MKHRASMHAPRIGVLHRFKLTDRRRRAKPVRKHLEPPSKPFNLSLRPSQEASRSGS